MSDLHMKVCKFDKEERTRPCPAFGTSALGPLSLFECGPVVFWIKGCPVG